MKDIHENSSASLAEEIESGRPDVFRDAILAKLRASPEPMTDRELMVALSEQDCNNIRPVVTRLKQAGIVVEVEKVKCHWTGKSVRRTRLPVRALNFA